MTTLPQLINQVEIVGTLKSIDLAVDTVKKQGASFGRKYIKGSVTVASVGDNKVHEHKINVFQMETNKKGEVTKLYKGLETVINEFKSIEKHGAEAADRIRVTGEVDLEEYYAQDGNLRSFNKIKGVFFSRLDAEHDQPDKAIASVEVIVNGFAPVADKNTAEILHYAVDCFTVGYSERIIEFKRAIVSEQLADAMQNLYEPSSTGRLTFKINNYVEKVEKEAVEEPVSMSHGFGSTEKPEENRVFDKRTSNFEIYGGDVPHEIGAENSKAFTPEMIAEAKRKRALVLAELKQNSEAPSTPPTSKPTGFGSALPDVNAELGNLPSKASIAPPPADIADDEMPDF